MADTTQYGIRDYLASEFTHLDKRLTAIEGRLDRIEQAGPRAGAYGAVGTALGGAVVAVLAYLGVRPPQDPQ